MDIAEYQNWIDWRLTAEPQPSGSHSQRRLGAVEILFDMLLKVIHPQKVDMLATIVEGGAARGNPVSRDHLWLMNTWGAYMQRRSLGLPTALGATRLDNSEAEQVATSAVGLLAMYASYADEGRYSAIKRVVSRNLLRQPRIRHMSEQELKAALAMRDPYVVEGLGAQQLCQDLFMIMGDIDALLEGSDQAPT